jgi:hypothetical protein
MAARQVNESQRQISAGAQLAIRWREAQGTDAFLSADDNCDGAPTDHEKMSVAATASAHMLFWLHLAFGMGVEVMSHQAAAHGIIGEVAKISTGAARLKTARLVRFS